jgi:hypothetical protein
VRLGRILETIERRILTAVQFETPEQAVRNLEALGILGTVHLHSDGAATISYGTGLDYHELVVRSEAL